MVTTGILWVAGIVLIVIGLNRHRFEQLLTFASGSRISGDERAPAQRGSEHPLAKWSRVTTLAIGGVCVVLAVLGTWSHIG